MSSVIPEIPLDVVIAIFKRLKELDDFVSLARCSRTCRLWYPEAQKIICSRAIACARTPGSSVPTNRWKEWGDFLERTIPSDPPYIVHLFISLEDLVQYSWLHAALTSLPRLRQLTLDFSSLHNFHPDGLPPPLEHSLDLVHLESWRQCHRHEDMLALLHYFANAKSLSLFRCSVDWIESGTPLRCDAAPSHVFVRGDSDSHFLFPFRYFRQTYPAQALRRLRLAFREYRDMHHAGLPGLLEGLSHLEALEFDFCTALKDTVHPPVEAQCQLIEAEIKPVFPKTVHTFGLHLSPCPSWDSPNWPIVLALLQATPTTLRHVEVHTMMLSRRFNTEQFAAGLARLPDLQTLEIILNELAVIQEGPEGIASYREFLRKGFPGLAARGALRLTSEIRSNWPFHTSLDWSDLEEDTGRVNATNTEQETV